MPSMQQRFPLFWFSFFSQFENNILKARDKNLREMVTV